MNRNATLVIGLLVGSMACNRIDKGFFDRAEPRPIRCCHDSGIPVEWWEAGSTGQDAGRVRDAVAFDAGRNAEDPPTAVFDSGTECGCCSHPVIDELSDVLHQWPRWTPGVSSRYLSSFDRKGGNQDGFSGTYSTLYEDTDGRPVLFDARGPGVIRTIWFTGPEEGGAGFDLGEVRFYFDGEEEARLVVDSDDWFRGEREPFLAPLVADPTVSTGGYVSWVPLPYRERLKITTERKAYFSIVQYDTLPYDTPQLVEPWESYHTGLCYERLREHFEQVLAKDTTRFEPQLSARSEAGEVVVATEGSGAVEGVRFVPDTMDDAVLHAARVRVFTDAVLRVDVPLDMFFGSGLGAAPLSSMAFTMESEEFFHWLVMPFWEGFRIEVVGIAGELSVDTSDRVWDRSSTGYLHAVHSQEQPTTPDRDFEWLNVGGSGKLVGTILTIRPTTPEEKRWWEGDLRTYVDGSRSPAMHGTGHEDDHLGGWSNTFLSGPFSLPMHGEPKSELIDRQGQYNANTTLYRLWPGITFLGGIRHSVEHGNRNGVAAAYEGVAFYYSYPDAPSWALSDELVIADAESRSQHEYRAEGESAPIELTTVFEGREDREEITARVSAHGGSARFTMDVRDGSSGCVLRRWFDQAQARQRATVRINGAQLGTWYHAEGNSSQRWAERDWFLPADVLIDRPKLRVELEPREDAPEWNAVRYQLFCLDAE